jgi:hypothetical protein
VGTSGQPKRERDNSLQEFIAYLYSVIRDDEAMVRVLDRVLKERYGSVGRRNH